MKTILIFLAISFQSFSIRAPPSINDVEQDIFKFVNFTAIPWIGKIVSSKSICTGILISPSYVLTAAHCASDENKEKIKFQLQSQAGKITSEEVGTIYKAGERIHLDRIIKDCMSKTLRKELERCTDQVHYAGRVKNDWMLVKLKSSILLGTYPRFDPLYFDNNPKGDVTLFGYPKQYQAHFALC